MRGGAIQTYIDGVLPYLSRRHEVTVVCREDPDLPPEEEAGGVHFARLPAPRPDLYYENVAAFLRAAGPFDAVEVFNRPAYLLRLAEAAGGARMLLSMHNDMFGPDRIDPGEARAVLDRVERVITVSDYVRRTIDGLYPGYGGKLRTIRSGVDTVRFQPWYAAPERRELVRRELGLLGGPVVLHVSRLSPKKGNHLVVQAMAAVRQTHPEAVLLMVGSCRYGTDWLDGYGQQVRREARELLGDGFLFAGFVPPVYLPDLFLAGDLFICASQWQEPLARVHYEAMASGLPIVTTDRGGNAEVIEEGVNGLIARPYDDARAFTARIRWLLDNPELREWMGRRGREMAEERYTWERVAAELLEVLE